MPSITPLSSRAAHRVEAKYNVVTDYPNLGLHSAAAKGNIGLVQYALTHGQPSNSVLDGILPLHAASSGGNELVVKMLIEYGADVNAPRLPRRYSDKNKEGTIIGSSGSTPLHFAAANGHTNVVRILLARGADPNRADKHGTKAETLATNFGHDDVVGVFKEWEASQRLAESLALAASSARNGASRSDSSPLPTPPSPSRSRKVIQVQRSLENLLSRRQHPTSPVSSRDPSGLGSTQNPISIDSPSSPFTSFNGTIMPMSAITPTNVDGSMASQSRRPSLPFIHEIVSGVHSASSKSGLRPKSAGQDAEQVPSSSVSGSAATVPTSGQRRLVSKISLLNLFKKTSEQAPPAAPSPLGGTFGASSPNLLSLQPPVEIMASRPRSSTEDVRSSDNTRGTANRVPHNGLGSAPPSRTTFFSPSAPVQARPSIAPLTRAHDVDARGRTDSSATLSSTSSLDSFPTASSPPSMSSVAINNWRARKDRAASEGAAMKQRSPLQTEWIRDGDGNVRELPGVMADAEEAEGGDYASAIMSSPQSSRQQSIGPSSGRGANGHNRSSSNQSTKLRFDTPVTIPEMDQGTTPRYASTQQTSPPFSIARRVSQKALRTSSSVGSFWSRKNSNNEKHRPGSAGSGEIQDLTPGQFKVPKVPSLMDEYDSADEGEDEEVADSVGELYGRKGSGSIHHQQRPAFVANLASPTSPLSSTSLYTPISADTTGTYSSGGRPWVMSNESQASVQSKITDATNTTLSPSNKSRTLSPTMAKPTVNTEVDSRLRGASISSSMSTDTASSSGYRATPSSTNGTSDSSSPNLNSSAAYSRSTSTTTVGMGGAHRTHYDAHGDYDYDSDSSQDYTKSSTPVPVPVLLRSVNSHAQAHALVEKAQQDILSLADLPPDSAGLSGPSLAEQLAAYGETLAVERRFAKGEAQKLSWINKRAMDEDSGDEAAEGDEEMLGKTPRRPSDPFSTVSRNGKSPQAGAPTSPTLHRASSFEQKVSLGLGRAAPGPIRTIRNRSNPSKTLPPTITTTPPAKIRTTPSNVGPQNRDMKPPRFGEDRHLNPLNIGGIEIIKTLPTPTDSPQSGFDNVSGGVSRQGGGASAGDQSYGDIVVGRNSLSDDTGPPNSAPLTRSRTPDPSSDLPMIPLSRVSTAPSNPTSSSTQKANGDDAASASHGRTSSVDAMDNNPPRSESRMAKKLGGFKNFVQTLKGKS